MRMRRLVTLSTCLMAFAGMARDLPAAAAPGELDPTFGTAGVVLDLFGIPGTGGRAIAALGDGRLLTAGKIEGDLVLIRYDAGGSRDGAFGTGGAIAAPFATSVVDVDLLSDGRILVAGGGFLARYTDEGAPDTSFDGDGIAYVPYDSGRRSGPNVTGIARQADDKILAVEYLALVRLLSDGTLDASFGSGGLVVNDNEGRAVAVQDDGKIVVTGQGSLSGVPVLEVDRYDADGDLDPSFGSGGIVKLDLNGRSGGIAVRVLADDRILVAARSKSSAIDLDGSAGNDFAVVRLEPDGALDASFGSGGVAVTAFPDNDATLRRMEVQSDGGILLAGTTFHAGGAALAMARYQPDGTPDAQFGSGGILVQPIPSVQFFEGNPLGTALQPDGKLVVSFLTESGAYVVLERFLTGQCGDGMVEVGSSEQCDDGNPVEGDGCDSNCTVTACGNGIASATTGETCDDGNPDDGDGCDSNCTPTACGNGVRTAPEPCDDGNGTSGDGCEADCRYSPVSEVAASGGSVTTDVGDTGPTPAVPVQLTLTTPNPGTVSMATPATPSAPKGFTVAGAELQVEAPPASAGTPLSFVFAVDASAIPVGTDPGRLGVLRNAVAVPDCTGPTGEASPDPCVASRVVGMDGDVELTVLTSQASRWTPVLSGLTKAEQTCVKLVTTAGTKVAQAQAKLGGSCLKNAAKGIEPAAQACLIADAAGKVAAAAAKTSGVAALRCAAAPPFGFPGAPAVNASAQAGQIGLVADLFGPDLGAAVIPAANRSGAGCQAKVLAEMQKLFQAEAKIVLKCEQLGLQGKGALFVSAEQMSGCLDALVADEDGKLAKQVAKLVKALDKCAYDPLTAFAGGACGGRVDFAACLAARVGCRVCTTFDGMNDLGVDCDAFDDGVANGSCG